MRHWFATGACWVLASAAFAQQEPTIKGVVVQGSLQDSAGPGATVVKPDQSKRPQRSVTETLKEQPGVSVGRAGGAAVEPVLRGLSGSRLPVVVDGVPQEAVCNHRMDPPTSTLSPESIARLALIRGPYSVLYGPAVAGVVELERDDKAWRANGQRAVMSATVGSEERFESNLEASAARGDFALLARRGDASQGNYRAGDDGPEVFSRYRRHEEGVRAAYATSEAGRIEYSYQHSDGKAAYQAFHMDATKLDTEEHVLRRVSTDRVGWLTRRRLSVSSRSTDHEMDDYSMRPSVEKIITNNAIRIIKRVSKLQMVQGYQGGAARADFRLEPLEDTILDLGAETRRDRFDAENRSNVEDCQTIKATGVRTCTNYGDTAWAFYDLSWRRHGMFAEAMQTMGDVTVKAGVRGDRQETEVGDLNDFNGTNVQPGAHSSRTEYLRNGFVRGEWQAGKEVLLHAGMARSTRPADFMERANFSGGPNLDAERSMQKDVGLLWDAGRFRFEMLYFVAHHPNFILVSGGTTITQERARRRGGEASLAVQIDKHWRMTASGAKVDGWNESRHVPLAQTPAPEASLGLAHERDVWGGGIVVRGVRGQRRVDPGYGNTLGTDIGHSKGFATWRLEGWWLPWPALRLSAGIDNLFDRNHAEHVSRTGSFAPAGFVATERVPEPGRSVWLRARLAL